MSELNLEQLAKFLVIAKKKTYASQNRMKIEPERPRFDELEFEEGEFYYRDSYCGFFQAPGMEIVRIGGKEGIPIWTMAYSGGVIDRFYGDITFAKQVFGFLKKALGAVPLQIPFRGPKNLKDGKWEYVNEVQGDIRRFSGHEIILYNREEVFNQDHIGGIVVDK